MSTIILQDWEDIRFEFGRKAGRIQVDNSSHLHDGSIVVEYLMKSPMVVFSESFEVLRIPATSIALSD